MDNSFPLFTSCINDFIDADPTDPTDDSGLDDDD